MRLGLWLGAAVLGMAAVATDAQAQVGGSSQRTSVVNRGNSVAGGTFLSSPFRLRNMFPSLNLFSSRNTVGTADIPNMNSTEYLKLFGYKKLY